MKNILYFVIVIAFIAMIALVGGYEAENCTTVTFLISEAVSIITIFFCYKILEMGEDF